MQLPTLTRNKWLRAALWLIATVAVMWALAWLFVPALLKQQLEQAASEQLGRKVSVGQIDFKPWTLELAIHDLAIASQDGASTQLQFKRLYANAEMESLLRLAPVVEALTLDGLQIRLTHFGGGKYDVDDLIARFNKPSPEPTGDLMRFALFNLFLTGGSFDFDDRSAGKKHTLRELNLALPFLSNLESRRNVTVEPKLAFNFNGSSFDSSAQTTPFASTRKTDASIRLRDFDLARYLPYVPANVPVRLQQGVLGAELQLAFEQSAKPLVRITGSVQLAGVKVADALGQPLLALEGLKVSLADVRPLEGLVSLGVLELNAPQLNILRDAGGRINLVPAAAAAAVPPTAAASASAAPGATAGSLWNLALAKLVLSDGALTWSDATLAPGAELVVRQLALEATGLTWPVGNPVQFQGQATVGADAPLKFGGSGTDQAATVQLSVAGLPLGVAAPYLAQFLQPSLRGKLSADLEWGWKAPDALLLVESLVLSDLVLADPTAPAKAELASVKRVSLSKARIDLARQTVAVGKLGIERPTVALLRAADQRWMFESWIKAAPQSPAASPKPAATQNAQVAAPWSVVVSDFVLDGGTLGFEDQAAPTPVAFELLGLKLLARDANLDGKRAIPLQLSARLRSARNEPGLLDYKGSVQLAPLLAQGNVVLTQIPVHLFEPYFGGGLNIELLRADASFKGEVRYAASAAGPTLKLTGDSALEEFRANTRSSGAAGLQLGEELLTWKALNLRGIDLALAPGAATVLSVKETALSDYFARVIVFPDGRINLQNLVKPDNPTGAAAPAVAASAAPAATSSVAAGPAPVIRIGPVSLINGKVFFSDRFVKPNYSANLSELTGKLSAFSSQAGPGPAQLADVELRGRAEGTASLEIVGKLNPLAKPLALDIKGIVRDLELAPLSPYSIKFAGHGIERGKLSVDVAYLVSPDGQLTASNKLVLNQLTFGDKVDGAPASLPVKLAVALLADRNGVIDINLPISGSLNDPQFSLGPIIFKVIVNLVVKAITAPFSLLASAFGGGGDELGMVAFGPGSAVLQQDAKAGLDKVVQALTDRPGLKLTVVGTASLEAEREAFKQERLRALLLVEKRRGLVSASGAASVTDAGNVVSVADAEKPALLKEVYKRADISKPRNAAGIATDLTDSEMEALLLANIPVTEDAMRELALQRGVAVKDYLASRQLPVERLFLGAAKPVAPDPKWTPRAELTLASN